MASTAFVNGVTLSDADWFNDVDALVYDVFNEKTTAGTSGTILRSNGTNIVNTTATYPATVTANRLLIASATNVISDTGGLSYNGTTLTVTGNVSPTTGIVGTITNDSAAAGAVGEIITGSLASGSATSLTTATAKTVISISLTAGDWDVSGMVGFLPAATTNIVFLAQGISTTNNTFGASGTYTQHYNAAAGEVPGAIGIRLVTPIVRVSIAATTTVYLIASASFSVDTLAAFGDIRARRVR